MVKFLTKTKLTREEIELSLEKHKRWLRGEFGRIEGIHTIEPADFTNCDLSRFDFRGHRLIGVSFRNANLDDCIFGFTEHCTFTGATLRGTDLRRANLFTCNIDGISVDDTTSGYHIECPEEGEFIAFKKAGDWDKIIKLKIPADAKRTSTGMRKCRSDKAIVLSIESLDGEKSFTKTKSLHDENFEYEVGKEIGSEYGDNRWSDWEKGIWFYITRKEAEMY